MRDCRISVQPLFSFTWYNCNSDSSFQLLWPCNVLLYSAREYSATVWRLKFSLVLNERLAAGERKSRLNGKSILVLKCKILFLSNKSNAIISGFYFLHIAKNQSTGRHYCEMYYAAVLFCCILLNFLYFQAHWMRENYVCEDESSKQT